jgi:hypothetical protein
VQLKEEDIDKAYFQQDGATAHKARVSMAILDDVFEDRIISTTIWPQDLRIFFRTIFFSLGATKNSAYSNNPHKLMI